MDHPRTEIDPSPRLPKDRRLRRPASAPPGWMFRPLGRVLLFAYRHGGAGVLGRSGMGLLTTVGRRSGKARTAPVVALVDDPDTWVIFGGYVALMGVQPAWYRNLVANPDQVWFQHGPRRIRVTPEVVTGEAREGLVRRHHKIAEYQLATNDPLPVVRLRPSTEDVSG